MQIKYGIIFLWMLGSPVFGLSQNLFDLELKQLADQLAIEVTGKMTGQNIAIADFVDENDRPSTFGKYLAEEFSYTLVNQSKNFKVIDRTQLRTLLTEAGLGDKGLIDPNSVQKLGELKGITAVLYGKLVPTGNVLRVFIKVVVLETQVNEIVVRGSITRTPSIESLLKELTNTEKTSSSNSPDKSVNSFVYQHIKIILKRCSFNEGYLDCTFEVTSIGRNDNFSVLTSDTQLISNNKSQHRAVGLSMGENTSSILVNEALRADTPVSLQVRFSNIPANTATFEGLQLNCKSYAAFSFKAQFSNIFIQ
ncbi:MAG: hypothetical protein HC892_16415 [Saprospiraceae bacterium]|nr:hypothetical protein [Saprospiraceae bacterium]